MGKVKSYYQDELEYTQDDALADIWQHQHEAITKDVLFIKELLAKQCDLEYEVRRLMEIAREYGYKGE